MKQVLFFGLCLSGARVSYYGMYLTLNQMNGDIYTKGLLMTILEMMGAFVAGFIIKCNFNLKKAIQFEFFIVAVSFLSTIYFPYQTHNGGSVFQLIPIFIAKLSIETMWTTNFTFISKVTNPESTQFVLAAANLMSFGAQNLIPYYIDYLEKMELNVFLAIGVVDLVIIYVVQNWNIKPRSSE